MYWKYVRICGKYEGIRRKYDAIYEEIWRNMWKIWKNMPKIWRSKKEYVNIILDLALPYLYGPWNLEKFRAPPSYSLWDLEKFHAWTFSWALGLGKISIFIPASTYTEIGSGTWKNSELCLYTGSGIWKNVELFLPFITACWRGSTLFLLHISSKLFLLTYSSKP